MEHKLKADMKANEWAISGAARNFILEQVASILENELDITLPYNTSNKEYLYEEKIGYDRRTYRYVTFGKIQERDMGVFKSIISECVLECKIWLADDGDTIIFSPHFDYKHHGGGSNGHDLPFRVKYSLDGNKIEKIK